MTAEAALLTRSRLSGYVGSISPMEVQSICNLLADGGPISSLTLILRIDEARYENLLYMAGDSWGISEILHESYYSSERSPFYRVRQAWRDAVGPDSVWSDLLTFVGIHACGLRGPTNAVLRFLNSELIRTIDSPIAAIVRSVPIHIPESDVQLSSLPAEERAKFELIEKLTKKLREIDGDADEVASVLSSHEAVAALDWFTTIGQKLFRFVSSGHHLKELRREPIARHLASGAGYIDRIGIGNLTRFGGNAGHGVKVCVIDSGADESSPWIQRKVVDYVRFDSGAHKKKAFDCIDNACHGTKMSTLICGRPLPLHELGLTRQDFPESQNVEFTSQPTFNGDLVRLSIAPGAKLVVAGALAGDPLQESATTSVLLAAFNWVAEESASGISIVNASVEADDATFDAGSRHGMELAVDVMKLRGLSVVVASGNHGYKSVPIAHNAVVVGAAHSDGTPWANNGHKFELLAPGIDILCGQPRLERLGNWLLDVYSGSSISTAIVSGAVALLSSAFNVDSARAVDALRLTAENRMINIDRAADHLQMMSNA